MKATTKLLGILVIFGLMTLVAGSVSAQSLKAQFDENGVGSSNGLPLTYVYPALDPISGFSTLMYNLPWPVTRGDLIITESSGAISDLIRFDTNSAGGGVAFFFSDTADEFPAPLADSPLGIPPPNAAYPSVTVPETGVEGNDGATYFASGGSPGCALQGGTPLGVFYTIISDSPVPEPATATLLGMCVIGLLAYGWRKRK
jgi:hypothetical protein